MEVMGQVSAVALTAVVLGTVLRKQTPELLYVPGFGWSVGWPWD